MGRGAWVQHSNVIQHRMKEWNLASVQVQNQSSISLLLSVRLRGKINSIFMKSCIITKTEYTQTHTHTHFYAEIMWQVLTTHTHTYTLKRNRKAWHQKCKRRKQERNQNRTERHTILSAVNCFTLKFISKILIPILGKTLGSEKTEKGIKKQYHYHSIRRIANH